jgi:VWFA-related protein
MLHRWRLVARAAWPVILLVALAGCASSGANRAPAAAPDEPPAPPILLERPPVLVVEAIVTDKKGAPVTTLRVSDFQVSVDGRRRPGAVFARLYRGPGAAALASSITSTAPGETLPLAEPSRTIVIVLDQPSFGPGDESRARTIVEAWMAAVGVADQVAVVSLPLRRGAAIAFERAAVRQTLAALKPLRAAGVEALLIEAAEPVLAGDDAKPPGGQAAGQQQDARAGENPPDEAPPPPRPEISAGDVSPAVLKAHAVSSLGGLSAVLRSLARAPGGKTILFVSAGLVATNAGLEAAAVLDDAARSQARIFALQVLTPAASYRDAGERHLREMAQETGGALVPLAGKPEAAIERLAGQLSFSYLLMLAPMAGDTDPGPHAIGVALPRRSDLVIQAPRRVTSGRVTADAIVASLSPRAAADAALPEPVGKRPAAPPQPGPPTGPPRPSFAHDPGLNPLVARVADYVSVYGEELSSVVSEETYTQEATGPGTVPGRTVVLDGKPIGTSTNAGAKITRTLVSDYLQVKIPGFEGWLPFRDVFEVDGQRVRDRQDRLVKLFVQTSPSRALDNAQAIVRESARYNIGNVRRELNVPTLPLWFLEPQNTRRFNFRKVGEDTLSGRRVVVVEYTEVAHPTFIKTPQGEDIVASGRIWAEPTTGRVHRTLLNASIASITVNYASRPEVPGLWLPVTMEEQYSRGATLIKGKATYANFRQFQVQTSEQIILPKK